MTNKFIERLAISVVALHSLVLGVLMLVAPVWTLGTTGWEYEGPVFFPAQSGVFLLILAGSYLAGLWYRPFAWLLVLTKCAAVLFLGAEYLLGNAPILALLAAFLDGAMGALVAAALLRTAESTKLKSLDSVV